MGRPRKCRFVEKMPPSGFYKPQGTPLARLKGAVLSVEGLEAMRLVDAEGLPQEEAAGRMDVSTPTLSRILAEARRTVARALSEGMALRIEGGDFVLRGEGAEGPLRPCEAGGRQAGAEPGAGNAAGPGCGRRRGRCARRALGAAGEFAEPGGED